MPRFGEGGSAIGYKGKNKTFFFFDYEGLRQDLGTTSTLMVPSLGARAGQLHNTNGTPFTVTVNSKIIPFLTIFPMPNGTTSNPDIGTFSFSSQAVTRENLSTLRIDHKFSDKDSLNGIFLTDPSDDHSPDSYNFAQIGQASSRKSISVEETHIFKSNLINVARIGYSRSVVAAPITLGAINPLATDTSL